MDSHWDLWDLFLFLDGYWNWELGGPRRLREEYCEDSHRYHVDLLIKAYVDMGAHQTTTSHRTAILYCSIIRSVSCTLLSVIALSISKLAPDKKRLSITARATCVPIDNLTARHAAPSPTFTVCCLIHSSIPSQRSCRRKRLRFAHELSCILRSLALLIRYHHHLVRSRRP